VRHREATTPNRSIFLLKFRDPLQASDFLVIFTGRPFSSLDNRETCHPIRIHHLILHHLTPGEPASAPTPIPAFPPSVYTSRARDLPKLLPGISDTNLYELPSCPVCLERLDSTITGLVTLPCAHTFDCDCLRKWGDSRCPVCRVSHLLLSSSAAGNTGTGRGEGERGEKATRLTECEICGTESNNWICVVCGVVGCGRYEPGKGHARRHWEESGHVLAMELETQRVWDYKGDKWVFLGHHI
jgi:BRCA1-associated protein